MLDFWEGMLARSDKIDMKELLDEKLGYPTPVSFEEWLHYNHYERLPEVQTKWLYRQELGYIESLKDVTLREICEQRIQEFTTALRKYII